MNLAQLLCDSAQRVPASPAIVLGTEVLSTFGQLASQVSGRASELVMKHRIQPGDRIAIFASNSPEYLEILFAIWWSGAVAIPLSSMLHAREVATLLVDSAARICIVSDDKVEELHAAIGGDCVVITVDELLVGQITTTRPVDKSPDQAAWVFFTSGTTGRPKGALLSHHNLLAMTTAYLADVEGVDERSGLLHLGLMSHAGGLFALPFVARGAKQVIPESRSADVAEAWDLLGNHDRLSLFAPPILLRRLVAQAPADLVAVSRMGTVLVGAAPVLANDLITGVEVFGPKVWNGYGQGETPCTITALNAAAIAKAVAINDLQTLRSVGYPRIGTEVRVVGADDQELPNGEPGEIIVRGPTVMAGYLDRPDANAETLRNGWLHTGDIGKFENGLLTLLDRSKDLVITGGANVYPREVEDILISHPSIADVAVIGIPDVEWGERLVACIVPTDATGISPDLLDEYCLAHIARYKRPKEYLVVDQLPRNGAGKVLKSELRATIVAPSNKE